MADHRGEARVVHVEHGLIRCRVFRPARHVLAVSVGKMRAHGELLLFTRSEAHLRGLHFDSLDARIFRTRPRRAIGDPIHERAPLRRIHFEPLAALVRHGARRLQQDERLRRLARIHPPPKRAACEREKIAFVIVAAQRQPQSPLPRRRSMASTRRAARLHQNRLHVIAKSHRLRAGGEDKDKKQNNRSHGPHFPHFRQ